MNGIRFQKLLSLRAGQALKEPIRSLVGAAGYQLIPNALSHNDRMSGLLIRADIEQVIDVGANQGQYALAMRQVGYRGHIVSFEPGKAAYHRLAARALSDESWDARQVALGDQTGSIELNVAQNSVSSSLLPVAHRHLAAAPESIAKSTETVRLARLDDELPGQLGPIWLKLDTQGYEMQVLKGAERVLSRTAVVQMELSLTELYQGQANWLELLSVLTEQQFTVVDLLPGFRSQAGDLLQCDIVAIRDYLA